MRMAKSRNHGSLKLIQVLGSKVWVKDTTSDVTHTRQMRNCPCLPPNYMIFFLHNVSYIVDVKHKLFLRVYGFNKQDEEAHTDELPAPLISPTPQGEPQGEVEAEDKKKLDIKIYCNGMEVTIRDRD